MTTCTECGKFFRSLDRYLFFCSNNCRLKAAESLGLTASDLLSEKMDDLALVIYWEYVREINMEQKNA